MNCNQAQSIKRLKYDRINLTNTHIMIEDKSSKIKALLKEFEQLKKHLLKKDLDQLVSNSFFIMLFALQ